VTATPSTLENLVNEALALADTLKRSGLAARRLHDDVPVDPAAVQAEVEAYMRGEMPGFQAQRATRRAQQFHEGLVALESHIAMGREGHRTLWTAALALEAEVAARADALVALTEPDPLAQHVNRLLFGCDRVRQLLDQLERWCPGAWARCGVLMVATMTAVRRARVDDMRSRLDTLRAHAVVLRQIPAFEEEAETIRQRLAHRLGQPLPVPELTWPDGDVLAPPALEEPVPA
jgi:hypothetical protein